MARVSLTKAISRLGSLRSLRLQLASFVCALAIGHGNRRRMWLFVLGLVLCGLVAVPTVSAHAVRETLLRSDEMLVTLVALIGDSAGVLAGIPPFEPVARGLLYVSLVVLVGVPPALIFIVQPVLGKNKRLIQRSWTLLLGASLLLALSAMLLGAIRVSRLGQSGQWVDAVVNTFLGQIALVQLVIASLLVGIGFIAVRRAQPEQLQQARLGVVAMGGALIALTVSLTSHSASHVSGVAGVLVDCSHLIGASVWVGGLAALALLVPPELDTRGPEAIHQATVRLIRRFSLVATAAVGLATATGLVLVAWHIPDFGALTSTRYGLVLSVKVLFVLVAIGLGGLNRFIIQRSLTGRMGSTTSLADGGRVSWKPDRQTLIQWFVRSVRVELTVLLLVLALTGALTTLPTATVAERTATDEAGGRTILAEESGPIEIRLAITPARVGQNTIKLSFVRDGSLSNPDRNSSVLLTHVETGIELPRETLTVGKNGRYTGTVVFPTQGQWHIQVRTHIDGRTITEQFSVRISPGDTDTEPETEPTHHNRTTDSRFAWLMRIGALFVGVATLLTVGYSAHHTP